MTSWRVFEWFSTRVLEIRRTRFDPVARFHARSSSGSGHPPLKRKVLGSAPTRAANMRVWCMATHAGLNPSGLGFDSLHPHQ